MEISFVTADVDGTLANPFVLATVLVWSTMLVIATAFSVCRWFADRMSTSASKSDRGLLLPILLAVLYIGTPGFQAMLGNAILMIVSPGEVWPVGFVGGPPAAPAWIAGAMSGIASAFLVWRKNTRVHGSRAGGKDERAA